METQGHGDVSPKCLQWQRGRARASVWDGREKQSSLRAAMGHLPREPRAELSHAIGSKRLSKAEGCAAFLL